MNRRKQFRAVATRYDKLADRYRGTVRIADIIVWLRARPDQVLKWSEKQALVAQGCGSA